MNNARKLGDLSNQKEEASSIFIELLNFYNPWSSLLTLEAKYRISILIFSLLYQNEEKFKL